MRDTVYRQDLYDRLRALEAQKKPISPTDLAFAFRNLPSADAVEVTRCEYCKHWDYENKFHSSPDLRQCEIYPLLTPKDFFCRSGEPRLTKDVSK